MRYIELAALQVPLLRAKSLETVPCKPVVVHWRDAWHAVPAQTHRNPLAQ